MKLAKPHPFFHAMTKEEIDEFLQGKTLVRLATLDSTGAPHLSPLWFLWETERLYMTTNKNTQKIRNLQRNPVTGFIIDTQPPNRGVHGRGLGNVIVDPAKIHGYKVKIYTKYLGGIDNPRAQEMLKRDSYLIELTPTLMGGWDAGKASH